jgi:hypothetical protein
VFAPLGADLVAPQVECGDVAVGALQQRGEAGAPLVPNVLPIEVQLGHSGVGGILDGLAGAAHVGSACWTRSARRRLVLGSFDDDELLAKTKDFVELTFQMIYIKNIFIVL